MPTKPDQATALKFVVTNTLIVQDIKRSVAFYRDVLSAAVLHAGAGIWPPHRGQFVGCSHSPANAAVRASIICLFRCLRLHRGFFEI